MFCSLDNTADKTIINALLAQLVEHLTLNQGVQGSSPWRRIAEHCFWDVEPGGGVLFCYLFRAMHMPVNMRLMLA